LVLPGVNSFSGGINMMFDDSFHQKLASMLERIVDREICETQEMPAVVDVMVRHEELLSQADGLSSHGLDSASREISEFDAAFAGWEALERVSVATTTTMPAFVSDDLAAMSCWIEGAV
jgi:hypothetical protein